MRAGRLPLWLAAVILIAGHSMVPFLAGGVAPLVSLGCLVTLALITATACHKRSAISDVQGWSMLALALCIWAGGMAANALMHLSLGHYQGDASVCLMFFVIYDVPIIFATSSPENESLPVRIVDALLASVLGLLFFAHIFSLSTLAGANPEDAELLTRMFDIENALVALFALMRFATSHTRSNRDFFGILLVYGVIYMLCTAYMDHWQKDADYGTPYDLVIDLPFMLLIAMVSRPLAKGNGKSRNPVRRERLAQAISPLMLPAMLLVVAATMLRTHPVWAVTGFGAATIVYGLRNVLTHLRNLEERDRLERLARIDDLTGLPNRRNFDATLQSEWARARRCGHSLSLLMIDIDHFKLLNDHLGHPEGDKRLRDVAAALAACASREGDMVARYGGEEFVVILPATTAAQAWHIAERMRTSVYDLALPTPAPGGKVSISIGVSSSDAGNSDPQMLLADADAALYEAKRGGRNAVHLPLAA